ncbi:hypothetical protein EII10_07210 [Actinomyces bowdenii]|uniref:Uncharacterized protein n=1 Tax=Actinomyces bowdenii TaxID=131109 RepID=A0A3P1V654_9ACTO|nr:hypothetical protein EII10_07210 [Actinomyces bowdenii]
MHHDLPTVLSLVVTGVLAGCRSLMTIWEYSTDSEALGPEVDKVLLSESTILRGLQDLDPTDLNSLLRCWSCTRTGTIEGRRATVVDSKTKRGAHINNSPGRRTEVLADAPSRLERQVGLL